MWHRGRQSRRGGSRGARHAVLMAVVALSLVLMHGIGASRDGSVDLPDAATGAANVASATVVLAQSHNPSDGIEVLPTGHQGQGSGHSGMMMKVCLAVLGALVVAVAWLLLVRQPRSRGISRISAAQTQRLRAGRVWCHPRTHVLCVMRT